MAALDCIVKLGGSALTYKGSLESLKVESLQRAAVIMHLLHSQGQRCILVHGAGSFGHFQAKEYNLSKGDTNGAVNADHLRRGLCLTRLSVTKLNHLVIEELVNHGIPAVGISPFGAWKTASRQVTRADVAAVCEALQAGYVPVLHGDAVLDAEQQCCILSGDTLIEILSRELSPKRVVFLTDVEGIYNQPPDNKGARLLDSIVIGLDGTSEPDVLTSVLPHDTTGGVKLKIQTATRIVAQSQGAVTVFVCKLDSEAAEGVCIRGETRTGHGTKFSLAVS
ncbi:isopentenyl phosphate kinase-like [Rhinatrema bivittatum]|uniref:isopentenyl phosphate kinase-like n=1 Tax=Rhinatrema bivittatum TaxID=194408 RepID=UPI0011265E62|nr:isopentenyl phosphate kinase-like [Rhinatrema bivittatum]